MQCIKNFISQYYENSLSYYFHTVFINFHNVFENVYKNIFYLFVQNFLTNKLKMIY